MGYKETTFKELSVRERSKLSLRTTVEVRKEMNQRVQIAVGKPRLIIRVNEKG
jgi:hypothetical protein